MICTEQMLYAINSLEIPNILKFPVLIPTTNADESRSVISTIVDNSRTKRPTSQERKASYLHDYQKEHQVALSSTKTQEREARDSMVKY